ncbi:intraflagellar transport protein 140 homolog [Neodiprion virginianus]|uniref:intraflagellar transport protein 140 homolog n=1 Tax=Neodiprion virginianus TaxID=2961670 RepID=UPI001EE72B5A|nr:intraflagellar transport protein 140 homolog [Neodiprion virginianus]
MSRPRERDEQEALKLDEQFKDSLARVRPYILALTAPEDVQLCRLWLDKLSYASTQRALRNEYLMELCCQVESGHVGGMFSQPPPNGPLPVLRRSYTPTVHGSSSWSELSDASTIPYCGWPKNYAKSIQCQFTRSKTPNQKRDTDSTSTGRCGHITKNIGASRCYEGSKADKNQIAIYEQRIETLTTIVKELQIQNERLNQELNRLQQNSTAKEVPHLHATIKQLSAEIGTLKAKLMEVKKIKDSLEASNEEALLQCKQSMDEKITELNMQLQEFQCKNSTLENNIAELTANLEKITRAKDEELCAVESSCSEKLEAARQQHEHLIKQKDEELQKKDTVISRKEEELALIELNKNAEIEKLKTEIDGLQKNLEAKKDEEAKLKAIVTEQCSTIQREFNKMRANMEAANQKQNQNLINKVASLKKGILKLEKTKERMSHEYEKRIYHILKDKENEVKALQLQLQGQRSELSMSLSSEKQCELDSLVESLEERYRSLLAAADASAGNQRQNYLKVWPGDSGANEFNIIVTPHRDPITILEWSQHGGRLVSADTAGSLIGWKIDPRGQLLMVFHHELKDSFTHIAFKVVPSKPVIDINGLAKAAVAGDERALDLFSSWRPRTAAPVAVTTQRDNHAFYIGTMNGVVYFVDSQGQCIEVLNTDGATLHCLLHHQSRDSVVMMTEGLNIGHFQADPITGRLTELTKVKLSGKTDMSRSGPALCWAGTNTLAVLTGELAIRCWDLHTGDTYVLSPPDTSNGNIATPQEICTSLSYCKNNETLAAGTNLGTIYLWKHKNASDAEDNGWPAIPESCTIHGTVKQLAWGATILRNPLLVVNCITNVFILRQQPMCAAYNDNICASQLAPKQILLETHGQNYVLKTDLQVQVVAVNKDYVAVSSGRQIAVYKLSRENSISTTLVGSFNCDTEKILIYESTLIVLTPLVIQLRSIEGSLTQTLPASPEEGEPITMELTSRYLTVASLNGILKIWDVSKREAKLYTRAKAVFEAIDDFAEIIEARCNSDCRCVSITVAMANLMPSSIFYVWDIESDQIYEYNFADPEDGHEESPTAIQCKGRLVTSHCWDDDDPRLLVCRAQKLDSANSRPPSQIIPTPAQEPLTSVVLITMFATSDHGIVVQDVRSVKDENCRLLGVRTPHIMILNSEVTFDNESKVRYIVMRDFEELGVCDTVTKKAILDFSFYISIANMDEAFKAIKTIQNEAIWKSLARMCVKTKQLNMASLCLGHMKHARGARALREAMQDDDLNLDAKCGILAVQLGLYEDAERLFRDANRLDLLCSMLEARNKYEESIDLAIKENKIREKTSYYNYAKTLEQEGKISEAIEMYTKADCHRFEVPRMLLSRPRELQAYLSNSDDQEIHIWHAQYIESTGDMEAALRLYESANDTLAMTRLLCYLGRDEEVSELVTRTNHAASAYHLAAHHESRNNIARAVHFYSAAKAYTNAIRICKENDMTEELWPLAMLAPRHAQIDVAKYFEEAEQPDKAVLLYHKAGMLHKALDLAFKTQQYNALQLITMDINADSDPALIRKCADYFVQNEQIDKAVDLLATGKYYMEALELIQAHNIVLTEDLAEKLTLEKIDNNMEREQIRTSTLEKIGEIAFSQGNYHLATKKFTQAGNKLRAMKALLKSGDTEKICFFAQVSRQREIYIMAGNYLQSLDWQNQPEVLKNIINFYSKGKAMDLLANFYVACAQVEIDEFQNYEKAFDALNQASRCLSKVTTPRDRNLHKRANDMVNNRMATIKRYLDIKKLFEHGETEAAVSQARQLIESQGSDLEQSVRRGDLFATLTQHYANIGETEKARGTIEELKRLVPGINLSYYYNVNLLEALGYKINIQRQDSSDKDDGIEELLGE